MSTQSLELSPMVYFPLFNGNAIATQERRESYGLVIVIVKLPVPGPLGLALTE